MYIGAIERKPVGMIKHINKKSVLLLLTMTLSLFSHFRAIEAKHEKHLIIYFLTLFVILHSIKCNKTH